jgi:acyl-CoA thioesterase
MDHHESRATRLDEALSVRAIEGGWEATPDAGYEALNGMLGGWTTAVMLAAIDADSDATHQASAITINFLQPVPPGPPVRVMVDALGGGRSVSHWAARVGPVDSEDVLAAAIAVFTARRASDEHVQVTMPNVPGPEGLEAFHPPDPAGERTDTRPVEGHPPFGRMDTRSVSWIREMSGRPMDRVQLAMLADQSAPRSFFWSDAPRPSATLTMTVYFHATDDELLAVGDDFVLHEAVGSRGVASTADQRARLWSRSGILLATTEQLTWYR